MATTAPLSEFALFRNLPEELLDKVAKLGEEVSFSQGDAIFREGDEADKLHFLLEGEIILKVKLTSRPEHITVSAVRQQYESFGWSGIVSPFHYTASAYCEEDCKVLMLPGKEFMNLLNENPKAGFTVMQRITEIVASRLRNSRQALLKTL
ncbi:MAG: cyclic nucleotide-binding domain-containing protein [Anaerolineales bacterium]|jgi:CRP-like cAMP-binding protein